MHRQACTVPRPSTFTGTQALDLVEVADQLREAIAVRWALASQGDDSIDESG